MERKDSLSISQQEGILGEGDFCLILVSHCSGLLVTG